MALRCPLPLKLQESEVWDDGWQDLLKKPGALLLDTRSPEEFAEKSINGSCNVLCRMADDSLKVMQEAISNGNIPEKKDTPILVYCAVGGRSLRAREALQSLGYTQVKNGGGIDEVRKAINDDSELVSRGRLVWIAGGRGMGKSTLGGELGKNSEWLHYEGDKRKEAEPESGDTARAALAKLYRDLCSGVDVTLSDWEAAYSALFDDIIKEWSAKGANYNMVVTQTVYTREVRSLIRSKLRPDLLVVLSMDAKVQVARLQQLFKRGQLEELPSPASTATCSCMEFWRAPPEPVLSPWAQGYEIAQPDEAAGTLGLEIELGMMPSDFTRIIIARVEGKTLATRG